MLFLLSYLIFTDAGQILVLTSPMIGNYGVPPATKDENGLPKFFESDKIHIAGLIVSEYSNEFSHWNAAMSLSQWLQEAGTKNKDKYFHFSIS